jgi:hypothetical protein
MRDVVAGAGLHRYGIFRAAPGNCLPDAARSKVVQEARRGKPYTL